MWLLNLLETKTKSSKHPTILQTNGSSGVVAYTVVYSWDEKFCTLFMLFTPDGYVS